LSFTQVFRLIFYELRIKYLDEPSIRYCIAKLPQYRTLNKSVSLYLDVVRLSAALLVLISHFAYTRLSGGDYAYIRTLNVGSDAVILFFVLSGYVIAYVSTSRERTVGRYALNRLSRLYSVVVPALLLTVVLDHIGQALDPALYDGWWYKQDQPVWRFLSNLFFINELWFFSIRPFTNGPFWSLSYEFWYYVLFGAAFYYTGYIRIILVALVLLIAGPKIILLLPIWLMGVWVFHFNQRTHLSITSGWVLFISPIIIYALIKLTGIYVDVKSLSMQLLGEDFVRYQLKFSDEFLISYVYGALVAMHFIGIKAIAPAVESSLVFFEKPIRYWAGLTFSIYLFHYPLLQFFAAFYGMDADHPLRHLLILVSTLVVIVLLGNVTEKKKDVAQKIISQMRRPWGLIKKWA